MSILSKLPIVGRGSYEPNFTAAVKGLDEIVRKAVSYEEGEYMLGTANLNSSPLSEVRVTLKTSADEDIFGHVVYPSHTLEAAIMGDGSKKSLSVSTEFLKRTGFSITGTGARKDEFLHIRNEKSFPKHTIVTYSGTSQKAQLSYKLIVSGLTYEEVSRTVTGFAEALEAVVKGVYKAAGKTPPNVTLELKLGEQVRRIRGRRVEVAGKQGNIASGKGEFDDETSAPNLEVVRSEVTFKNIGGYQSVKEQLRDFLLAIKNPAEARRHGYSPSKGWLLYGPTGTGKTLFGKALAGEAGAEFVYFNAADALQMYVGQSTKALKAAFEGSQKRADETKKPVILFIDEIDSIFPKRGTAHHVNDELVNLFNQYMDGFETGKIPDVFVVAATNRLHEMDESATRTGRFVKIEVPLPDLEARTAIFKVTEEAIEKEAGTQLFDPAINYTPLAERAEKFSGADIAQVMREARQKAFRQAAAEDKKNVITTSAADLEAQINNYRRQKQDGSGKGPIGFGRRVGG